MGEYNVRGTGDMSPTNCVAMPPLSLSAPLLARLLARRWGVSVLEWELHDTRIIVSGLSHLSSLSSALANSPQSGCGRTATYDTALRYSLILHTIIKYCTKLLYESRVDSPVVENNGTLYKQPPAPSRTTT